MPISVDELTTSVEAVAEGQGTESLSESDFRKLAELVYALILEELRIERERLGR